MNSEVKEKVKGKEFLTILLLLKPIEITGEIYFPPPLWVSLLELSINVTVELKWMEKESEYLRVPVSFVGGRGWNGEVNATWPPWLLL